MPKNAWSVHENVLNQLFTADAAHQVWMAEITYIGIDEGWLVLASILDLFTRKVVGWQAGEWMTKELAIQALEKAVQRERPKGEVLHIRTEAAHMLRTRIKSACLRTG